MPEQATEPQLEKSVTETFFGCVECKKKMLTISIGSSSDGLFGLTTSSAKAMYCDNKDCHRYGLLTVAGLRMTQEEQ